MRAIVEKVQEAVESVTCHVGAWSASEQGEHIMAPLPQLANGFFALSDALVFGPGLGRSDWARALWETWISGCAVTTTVATRERQQTL